MNKKGLLFGKKTAIRFLILALFLNVFSAYALNEGPPSFSLKKTVEEPIKEPTENAIPSSNPFGNSGQASLELPKPMTNGSALDLKTINTEIPRPALEQNNTEENEESSLEINFEVVPRVENLNVSIKNQNTINLSFDEIKGVETYFVLYGTSKVESEDDIYNMPPVDTEGKSTIEISDLEANVDYYFSVVAKANEDYSEYLSDEVSAKIDLENLNSPSISGVKAKNNLFLEVEFSTDMNLDELKLEDLSLNETFDDSSVEIYQFEKIDNTKLSLRTSSLKSGYEYKFAIENLKSTDTLELDSNELTFRTEELQTLESFEVTEVNVFDHKGVEIVFNDEPLDFSTIKDNLNFVLKSDPNQIVKIEDVLPNPTETKKALVVLEGLTDDDYQVLIEDLEGFNKGKIIDANKTKDFKGINPPQSETPVVDIPEEPEDTTSTPIEDITSPVDVRNLNARFIDEALTTLEVSFDPSLDLDNDLEKYELYFAKDSDNYFAHSQINKDQTDPIYVKDLDLNAEYYNVKVTAKDSNNNESMGTVFKLYLPETGPAGTLALMAMSILGSRRLTRRKD